MKRVVNATANKKNSADVKTERLISGVPISSMPGNPAKALNLAQDERGDDSHKGVHDYSDVDRLGSSMLIYFRVEGGF